MATPRRPPNCTTAVAWSECSESGCRGWLATLTSGAELPKLAYKVALVAPAKVFGVDRSGSPGAHPRRRACGRCAANGDRLTTCGYCNLPSCLGPTPEAGCKPTKKLVETWSKTRGQKRYARVAC